MQKRDENVFVQGPDSASLEDGPLDDVVDFQDDLYDRLKPEGKGSHPHPHPHPPKKIPPPMLMNKATAKGPPPPPTLPKLRQNLQRDMASKKAKKS